MKRFGVSTHLYHEQTLQKAHLLEIASPGFERSKFATRSHFDYHALPPSNRSFCGRGVEAILNSIHAPITAVVANGRGKDILASDTGQRRRKARSMNRGRSYIARTLPSSSSSYTCVRSCIRAHDNTGRRPASTHPPSLSEPLACRCSGGDGNASRRARLVEIPRAA